MENCDYIQSSVKIGFSALSGRLKNFSDGLMPLQNTFQHLKLSALCLCPTRVFFVSKEIPDIRVVHGHDGIKIFSGSGKIFAKVSTLLSGLMDIWVGISRT